jgi:preprotein translocase subunit YajC
VKDQRRAIVLITLALAVFTIAGFVGFDTNRDQQNEIDDQQERLARTQQITLGAICIVADVIRAQPRKFPSVTEGETEVEYEVRIAAVKAFLRASNQVDCAAIIPES